MVEKIYAKLSKCTFGAREVEYLGFVSKSERIAMNPKKTKSCKGMKNINE